MSKAQFVGVDGARNGWVCAIFCTQSGQWRGMFVRRFLSIVDDLVPQSAGIVVDIPIGLAPDGRRVCDALARNAAGKRRASLFNAPCRATLSVTDYKEANRLGKSRATPLGLSLQSWNLIPKIREVDDLMSPPLQKTICEGHPELTFARLTGYPCAYSKKTKEGRAERISAMEHHGVAVAAVLRDVRCSKERASDFVMDDIIDACALALCAKARLEGTAWRFSDDQRDERGLVMEIWA